MFVENNSILSESVAHGVTRKVLAHGGSLMMVEVKFEKGAIGSIHSHVHEQISYVTQGCLEFNLYGDKRILHAGDTVYIPSNVAHGVLSLEDDTIIIDVFTPLRQDFLK